MSLQDIRNGLKKGKLVLGTRSALKALKLGKLEKIYVTSNCPDTVKKDIDYYSSLGGYVVEKLSIPNDELGVICKKQFSISVAGLLK